MGKTATLVDKWNPDQDWGSNKTLRNTLDAPIVMEKLSIVIRKAKTGKARGLDMTPVKFYKYGGEIVYKSILDVFNFGLRRNDYPQICVYGVINSIYEIEKMSKPENYRKITLLSSLGKVFDSVMNNRMSFVKEARRIENPFQNGFKQGTQSTDNLFILNSVIDKYNAVKRQLYICYVDFKSAFDFISRHHALLFKLLSQGFNGKLFRLLRSLFSNDRSRVKCKASFVNYYVTYMVCFKVL